MHELFGSKESSCLGEVWLSDADFLRANWREQYYYCILGFDKAIQIDISIMSAKIIPFLRQSLTKA